jgi:prolyl-tRNA synthetase
MVLTDAGEDDILYCAKCDFCVNVEVSEGLVEGSKCKKCDTEGLKKARASEVGNVFDLGQKYGDDFGLSFLGRDSQQQFPVMGCYGIGISRVMGVIVEKFNDSRGIIWPQSVAPFQVYLISIGKDEEAERFYEELKQKGIEVFYDDRSDKNPGEKFADCDLMGIPFRVVMSGKTEEGKVEVKKREGSEVSIIAKDEFFSTIS